MDKRVADVNSRHTLAGIFFSFFDNKIDAICQKTTRIGRLPGRNHTIADWFLSPSRAIVSVPASRKDRTVHPAP